jgi:GNAT superfamily N-acetyltransferase
MELIGAAGIQNRIKLRMVNYNILKYVIPTIVIYFFDFARLYLRLSILQSGEKIDGRISFFYILKRYRGLGFGQYFIHQLLILFPKISHIDTSISNKKALYLYSKFDFIEYRRVFGLVGLRRSRIL